MAKLVAHSTHRLMCGDSTDHASVAILMSGEKASLLFTSPLYGNQRQYEIGKIDWDALMMGVFANLPMTDDGQILVNLGMIHTDGEWNDYWRGWVEWMRSHGWRRVGWYVWDQGSGLPGDFGGRFAPSFEFVFHFNREKRINKSIACSTAGETGGGGCRGAGDRKDTREHTVGKMKIPDNVIRINRDCSTSAEYDHPAIFPVALAAHMQEAFTDPQDICYEPFSGSGTPLMAGERTGRRVFAMEIASSYVDLALKRWVINTDQPAYLESTGERFNG